MEEKINQYIREVQLDKDKVEDMNKYPFCLPVVKNLDTLELHPRVTFLAGENGSGKSTLLEAIAVAYGFNPEGGTKNTSFSTSDSHSELHQYINLVKGMKMPRRGFFLRAESIYNIATYIDDMGIEGQAAYGGVSLHEQSHGESFFTIFKNQFSRNGIYILDEPEAALSPMRQMSLITMINDLVNQNCQFIIATHSPIIMSYPRSTIYEIKDGSINEVSYEECESYQITREFLNNKDKFLDILMG